MARKIHKRDCKFTINAATSDTKSSSALGLLRELTNLFISQESVKKPSSIVAKVLNIAELRLAIFRHLPALTLLSAQRTCRVWYQTIALDHGLQQRLFLSPGPGELVLPASKGAKVLLGIQPRNKRQVGASNMERRPMWEGQPYLYSKSGSSTKEATAAEIEQGGRYVILNPFFTSLWLQDHNNMTSSLSITTSTAASSRDTSWRRMQLTSPPTLQLSMTIWHGFPLRDPFSRFTLLTYDDVARTSKNGCNGNRLLPNTGRVPIGVTLGHLADLIAAQPSALTKHWMQIHGQSWWTRSADAVVVPPEGERNERNEAGSRPGAYVNPSNGIAMPGFLG